MSAAADNAATAANNNAAADDDNASYDSFPDDAESSPYLQRRIAKSFYDFHEIFFGTVTKAKPPDLWHVVYDDDDSQDMDEEEIRRAFRLYERKKYRDPKRVKTAEEVAEEEALETAKREAVAQLADYAAAKVAEAIGGDGGGSEEKEASSKKEEESVAAVAAATAEPSKAEDGKKEGEANVECKEKTAADATTTTTTTTMTTTMTTTTTTTTTTTETPAAADAATLEKPKPAATTTAIKRDLCDICQYGHKHQGLTLLQCRKCKIHVHRECYGLQTYAERVFVCWACDAVGKDIPAEELPTEEELAKQKQQAAEEEAKEAAKAAAEEEKKASEDAEMKDASAEKADEATEKKDEAADAAAAAPAAEESKDEAMPDAAVVAAEETPKDAADAEKETSPTANGDAEKKDDKTETETPAAAAAPEEASKEDEPKAAEAKTDEVVEGTKEEIFKITQKTRPTHCVLCTHNVPGELHAMHPVYDNQGPRARQKVYKDKDGNLQLAWTHSLCAFMLSEHNALYGVQANGTTHEGSTEDPQDTRIMNPYLYEEDEIIIDDLDFGAAAPMHHFVYFTKLKDAEKPDKHTARAIKLVKEMQEYSCFVCDQSTVLGMEIPVQCSANDKFEYCRFRGTHEETLKPSETCTAPMHVGCAMWGANTHKTVARRVFFFPGSDTMDPVNVTYCSLHAPDVTKKHKEMLESKKNLKTKQKREGRKRAMEKHGKATVTDQDAPVKKKLKKLKIKRKK